MSRIKHLIRPELPAKVFSWKMAIPLAGLSAACAVLYAQVGVANAVTEVAKASSASAIPLRATPNVAASPALPAVNSNTTKTERKASSNSASFALVKTNADGSDSVTNNSGFDAKEIEVFRRKSKDETLWFRENGKAFAIRDKATLDKVKQAYKPMDDVGAQMDMQGKKMDEQGKIMDEIGKQMDAVSANQHEVENSNFDSAMRKHEKKMAEFEKKMEAAAAKLEKAHSEAERSDVLSKMRDIQSKIQEVAQKIQQESHGLAEEHQKMAASLQPLEELGKKMHEAGKPMDALGKEMDALGKQMDVVAKQAEKQVRELIQSAKEKGLVIPASEI